MQSSPSQNAPCPCGSGKKYKRCCGRGRQAPADKFQQVIKLYQQGNLQAAEHLAGQLLRNSPNEPALIEISAVAALQLGKPEQAITQFKHQLELQPGNALAHSNLCMALHSVNRDEEAFQHCQQAVNLDPDLADAWNNLGNIHKTGNNLDKALAHYERALQLDDSDPRVHVNAGSVSQLLGNLEAAERHYRAALKIYPDFAAALNNLGTALQQQQRNKEAEQAFLRAIRLQPRDPEALTNYGSLLLNTGDTAKARKQFERAIQAQPHHVGAYVGMGNLYDTLHDPENTRRYYDKALLLDPVNATVLCNLGYRRYEIGDQQQAVEYFIRALKSDPNSAKALAGLGKAMLRQDENDLAAQHINKALQLAPWDVHVHIAKALLDTRQNKLESAESEWLYVIEQQPQMCDGYIGLAKLYADLGRYDDARTQYLAAEENQATNIHLYHAWSSLEEQTHQLEAAGSLAEKAFALDPEYPGLAILKSKLARRDKDFDSALSLLTQLDTDKIEDKRLKATYLFELGHVLDKLGRYPEAFSAYDSANQVKNHYLGHVFNPAEDQQRLARWQAFYSEDNWLKLAQTAPSQDTTQPSPIFIVGFPRSGTSLLEQILGSHPQFAPAGELTFIHELAEHKAAEITGSELPYPELLLDSKYPADRQKLLAMRAYYLDSLERLGVADTTTRWVTDKLPHNALHLGLIALLFPQSPIIHIARHPLNACLSAYYADFSTAHRYTSSLQETARHYQQVLDMLEHYRRIGIKYLEVRYEDLVQNQEKTTRQILEYIGAPWDDACLQHHKSSRVVKTASYEQVTQKIYTTSLYRYRNYRQAVEPIIPILEPTMSRLGYTAD